MLAEQQLETAEELIEAQGKALGTARRTGEGEGWKSPW